VTVKILVHLAYGITWIIHWSWILWATLLIGMVCDCQSFWIQVPIALLVWFLVVKVSGGCPFTYIEQHLEVRMGYRNEVTYTLEESMAYRYVIKPSRDVIHTWLE